MGDEIEQLAWVVLRAANRRQAKIHTSIFAGGEASENASQ